MDDNSRITLGLSPHHLDMSWTQVSNFVADNEGRRCFDTTPCEQLKIAANEFGYEMDVFFPEKSTKLMNVTFYRDDEELHTFSGIGCFDMAHHFLKAELAYNVQNHPNEKKPWSPEGLNALCLDKDIFATFLACEIE